MIHEYNKYEPKKNWTKLFNKVNDISYPAEGVIRIFKGKFPKLKLKFKKNQKILDLGFGDGRHVLFLKNLGLNVFGSEISSDIVNKAKKNFKSLSKNFNIGTSDKINFKSNYFDILLSWNSCYYMNPKDPFNFKQHVHEMNRVLKTNGLLILSIPKKSSFIYKNSKKIKNGYREIKDDYFKVRDGQIMRCFENKLEIEKNFKRNFKNFVHSSIDINWFGLDYHWHILIAKKK